MRRMWVPLLLLALLPQPARACTPQTSTPDNPWLITYQGSAGGWPVRMTLAFEGKSIEGLAAIGPAYDWLQKVRGTMSDPQHLTLQIGDWSVWKGTFQTHDPKHRFGDSTLNCEVITGIRDTWAGEAAFDLAEDSEGAGTLTHRYDVMGVTVDRTIDQAAWRFWNAVRRGDRRTVSALVAYPLTVKAPAGILTLHTPGDLIRNYGRVFTPAMRQAIDKSVPALLSANYEGAMLGNGAVWFNAQGRISAINP
ncbi:MAG TPA: hypothetical protein V6D47_04535 [Oscillatoriaceae cyanobacterium]